MIHPSAIVHPGARCAPDVVVGPHSVVEDGAELGPGVVLGAGVHVHGCVRLGARTRVASGAVLGGEPQDVKYKGAPSRVEIGEDVRIHEHVTVHRATTEGGVTRVGDGVMLMASSHVAHDCTVGERAILTNGAMIAGHSAIGERAILSGNATVHQFCRVGRLTMLAGPCGIGKDAIPFSIFSGSLPAVWRAPNTIGLRRAGFTPEERLTLRLAILEMLGRRHPALDAARRHLDHPQASVREVAEFVLSAKRGVILARRGAAGAELDL
ncbi:MAG: acyl-ACP--UDP-N-acetylglucosamine O-acyltransferase [Planctomycetes bacterium]|nr:acyl-ACP--UDP-N-acetylglucosamine O-acyltransferase [Planctomycetota bacterium]